MNRYVKVITEIQQQQEALQSIIDAKKAELEALQIEIPELEAQLVGLIELYTNTQLLQAVQTDTTNSIVVSSPTVVSNPLNFTELT